MSIRAIKAHVLHSTMSYPLPDPGIYPCVRIVRLAPVALHRTASRAASGSLQAQPAPCDRAVSLMGADADEEAAEEVWAVIAPP